MKVSQIFTAPNQLTMLRMVFVPFIVIELVEGRYLWALVLFVIAGFSDGLDGLLARKLHQQTLLGQYLDPIADKLLLSTLFSALDPAQNSVEVYRAGFQSRYFYSGGECGFVCDCRVAEFPAEYFRESEYFFADCRSFLRDAA